MTQPAFDRSGAAPVASAPALTGPAQTRLPADGILQVAWRRKAVVAVTVGAFLAGSAMYVRHATPRYDSTAKLFLDRAAGPALDHQESAPSDNYLAEQCSVLRSAPLLGVVLQRPDVQAMKTFDGQSDALAVLQDHLVADAQRKEDVINVTYEGRYPDEAAALVNAVIEEYCRGQDERTKSSTATALTSLERTRAERDGDRSAALKAMLDFKRQNPVLSLESGKGSNVVVDRLAALSDALTAAQLDASLAKANYAENGTDPSRSRWLAAQVRADEVKRQYDEQTALAISLNTTKTRCLELSDVSRRAEELWESADKQVKDFKGGSPGPLYRIAVLEPARAPSKAVWPDPLRLAALAGVMGLVFGGGIALAVDRLDRRMRTVNEVAVALGLPVVGAIPHMPPLGSIVRRGRQTEFHPHSSVSESIRDVRTALMLSAEGGPHGTLLVASPTPGDGKSLVASNLAIALAKAGKKVLLIDADLRRPTQHRIFRLPATAGLAGILSGDRRVDAAICPTATEGLYVLPCGQTPPNPAELLHGQLFAVLLAKVSKVYDHVVIDSSPIVTATDARIIASLADRTLLVVRCNKSTREASELACDGLTSVGAKLLSVVVNDVRRGDDRFGRYRYCRYVAPVAARAPAAPKRPELAPAGTQLASM